jgi:hypothetical protein
VTTGVLCLAAGTVVAGTVVVGIVVAGIVVAGIVVAGIVVAGIVVAGTVAAGIVVAGIVVAGIVVAGIVVAGTVVPDEFNLTTNASSLPADVRLAVPALGSKSAVPSNPPVMYIFPEVSTATPRLVSEPDPPNCRAHTYDPDTSNLRTYASRTPLAVRFAAPALGSKSTVPAKDPVTYVFPEVSTATPTLSSEPDPPKTETVAFASVGVHARRICGIAANTPNTVRTAMKIRRTP